MLRQTLERRGGDLGLLSGFFPVAVLDGFADSGQCFYAVAGVEAGGVDLVAEPWAAGEASLGDEGALGLIDLLI